ncbi:MAG: hypothetical protein HUK24_00380 [Sphaerochaetaceae bacterium]|nr:hypothetical protein [Sphaerochaetaceae bacterium]
MTTEYDVMEALKDTMVSKINRYLEEGLTELSDKNFEIDFPDPDCMRKDTMIFIQPDYGNYEDLSLMSDQASLSIQVFIISKGAPAQELIKRTFGYYSAIYNLLRTNQSLGCTVESTSITDMDYYPALSATSNIVGIEAKCLVTWAREFQRS